MEIWNESWITAFLEKVKRNGNSWNGRFAHVGLEANGDYRLNNGGMWTDSFWVGIFYLSYMLTGSREFLNTAENYQPYYKKRVKDDRSLRDIPDFVGLDHDAGFIFTLSQVANWKLTGNREARAIALEAADVLASRFNNQGAFIRAFDPWSWETDQKSIYEKRGRFIVDSMMNLPLLYWAYQETGDKGLLRIANLHAESVKRHIIREDGSTFHVYQMDPDTFLPVKGMTGQGYSDLSCWARGQAWAVYGFAVAYSYSHITTFLEAAVQAADYILAHLPQSGILPWDFAALHNTFCPWDSSAQAVAAAGMLELHEQTGQEKYRKGARMLLKALHALCDVTEHKELACLLLHGCVGPAYAEGNEAVIINPYIDVPTPYGDYFYAESVCRLCMGDKFIRFW